MHNAELLILTNYPTKLETSIRSCLFLSQLREGHLGFRMMLILVLFACNDSVFVVLFFLFGTIVMGERRKMKKGREK